MNIPYLHLTTQFNANHRYRLFAISPQLKFHWLLTVRFSNKDQSLYLMPLLSQRFGVLTKESGEEAIYPHNPGSEFHLSIHESGVINLTTSEKRVRLRKGFDKKPRTRKVLTLLVNSLENFPQASLKEINSPRGGHRHLPIVGLLPSSPMAITIYCSFRDAEWSVPPHGNTFQIHYQSELINKDFIYHFVIWQHDKLKKQRGEIAIEWGGETELLGTGILF